MSSLSFVEAVEPTIGMLRRSVGLFSCHALGVLERDSRRDRQIDQHAFQGRRVFAGQLGTHLVHGALQRLDAGWTSRRRHPTMNSWEIVSSSKDLRESKQSRYQVAGRASTIGIYRKVFSPIRSCAISKFLTNGKIMQNEV